MDRETVAKLEAARDAADLAHVQAVYALDEDTGTPAPAAEPVKPIDPEVQATIERNDYLKMLNECIPTLKAEYHAAMFMRAFLMQAGDTHVHRAHFMRSAGRVTGGLPPMTETALNIIQASKPAKSRR